MAFDRAGTLPTECSCGRKAKETIVIFGIADHHQRFTFVRARFVHQFLHQFLAHAALLDCWQDSNGPYHDERMLPSRSEEHTSELQSLMRISYAVFCLKKTKTTHIIHPYTT